MKSTYIEYGDGEMETEVPESATILTPDDLRQDPPAIDPYEAIRKALENPLGMPPLKDLAKPGMKVVICCPDRVKGGAHKEAHRKVCIPIIVEELRKGGIELNDIKLIMCPGLHAKIQKWNLIGTSVRR